MTLWSLCRISNILYDICQIAFFGCRRPKSRPLKRDYPQKLEFIFCVPGVFTGLAPYSPCWFNVRCSMFDVRCSMFGQFCRHLRRDGQSCRRSSASDPSTGFVLAVLVCIG